MKTIFYPENGRGINDIGWLKAKFSFSFGPHHNPNLMSFGALRVLNDDIIAGGKGFGLHPHDNMEIVTIPLEGGLEHQDNMGNKGVINVGDVQIMSAGTGVYHSEYNASKTAAAKTLQIWLFPKERNVTPRYDQKSFTNEFKLNELTTLVSPDRREGNLWLHQDAIFSMGTFEAGKSLNYIVKTQGNGAYVFLLDGRAKINGIQLNKRDAMGVYDTSSFTIETEEESRYLIIDVPMS